MFLVSFLPEWIFYAAAFISAAALLVSTLFSALPIIGKYGKAIQIGSFVALLFSVYLVGGVSNEASWQAKVLKQQAEIAELKQKEAEVTTKVVTKYVDRIQVVKEQANEIVKYVTQESDAKCELPVSFSVLHDAAAKNELPDSTRATDETTSNVKLSEATTTIVTNYGICNQNSEQLKALQEWVSEQKKLNP
jgi:hypothetical protein